MYTHTSVSVVTLGWALIRGLLELESPAPQQCGVEREVRELDEDGGRVWGPGEGGGVPQQGDSGGGGRIDGTQLKVVVGRPL